MLRVSFCLIGLLFFIGIVAKAQTEEQLTYHPRYGVYSVPLYFLDNKDPLQVIFDTASDRLIVLGDKFICPRCKPHITRGGLTVDASKLSKRLSYARYGSADMTFKSYSGKVGFKGDRNVKLKFAVVTSGENISNILGMATRRIELDSGDQQLPTLFDAMRDQLKLSNQFSLLLCGQRAASYVYFSKQFRTIHSDLRTPIISKYYYGVGLTGIKSGGDQIVPVLLKNPQLTILDSGTGGLILLPKNMRNKIIHYIYTHSGHRNQQLPQKFWQENECITQKKINYKQFPVIQFGFARSGHAGQSFYLDLKPEHYINGGSCPVGMVHLVFQGIPDSKRHSNKKIIRYAPKIIMGTPFFEAYKMTFNLDKPAEVIFVPSDQLCK